MKKLIRRLGIWLIRKAGDVNFTLFLRCEKCRHTMTFVVPNGCDYMEEANKVGVSRPPTVSMEADPRDLRN